MTEVTLLLIAALLIIITTTGAYKKRLKSIPFLIVARVLIIGTIIYYCIINEHLQRYHLIVSGAIITWIIYDTALRILHNKSTT